MADSLRNLGRNLGLNRRSVSALERRGGLLPQIDRTRGSFSITEAFIASFVTNESSRKMSLSLDFTGDT